MNESFMQKSKVFWCFTYLGWAISMYLNFKFQKYEACTHFFKDYSSLNFPHFLFMKSKFSRWKIDVSKKGIMGKMDKIDAPFLYVFFHQELFNNAHFLFLLKTLPFYHFLNPKNTCRHIIFCSKIQISPSNLKFCPRNIFYKKNAIFALT